MKGVGGPSCLPDFIGSCIFPKCRMTHDLMMPVWNPDILTLLHPAFRFFKELEERHQQSIVIDDISDIVCKHAQSNFDPYVTYCSNEVYQQRTLQRLVWVAEQTHTSSYRIPSWIRSIHFEPALCLPLISSSFLAPSDLSCRSKNSVFKEVLTRIEGHPDCRNLPMISFLILPMQRITRLPLLMDVSPLETYSTLLD